jgi:hypothetical protein
MQRRARRISSGSEGSEDEAPLTKVGSGSAAKARRIESDNESKEEGLRGDASEPMEGPPKIFCQSPPDLFLEHVRGFDLSFLLLIGLPDDLLQAHKPGEVRFTAQATLLPLCLLTYRLETQSARLHKSLTSRISRLFEQSGERSTETGFWMRVHVFHVSSPNHLILAVPASTGWRILVTTTNTSLRRSRGHQPTMPRRALPPRSCTSRRHPITACSRWAGPPAAASCA